MQLGEPDYLILGGLSGDQISYLDFLSDHNILEINDRHDVDILLKDITDKTDFIECNEDDIVNGLITAMNKNALLRIDNSSENIILEQSENEGLIVIEDIKKVSSIIAVNYAQSINATVELIEPPEVSQQETNSFLQKWKDGSSNAYYDLSAKIYPYIEDISFSDYRYCTFFTKGIPYSLILENLIPITHVNLLLNPDFFVFNNLYFERNQSVFSSIVFSPLEFGHDEETGFVIKKLGEMNHHVRQLVGTNASVYNIDLHVKEYPYEVMHICSHGGEVGGFSCIQEFIDSDGNKHVVEYDEVISIAPERGQGKIPVQIKYIFRKFDGLNWKSKELKEKYYPHYVFTEMVKKIGGLSVTEKDKKDLIADSCAIKCHFSCYQALFNSLSGNRTSPLVFNNTCWSWSGIAEHFILCGTRAYIGTLWSVNNSVAKETAKEFYSHLENCTILESLQKSLTHTSKTSSEHAYLFWGLHFSTISMGKSISESRIAVTRSLVYALRIWMEKLRKAPNNEQIAGLIRWIKEQLSTEFFSEFVRLIIQSHK